MNFSLTKAVALLRRTGRLILCLIVICLLLDACKKNTGENELKAAFSTIKSCTMGAPCTIQFKNHSSGDATYRWDFGDNSTYSSEKEPEHTYKENGIYKVVLTAQYAKSSKTSEQTLVISTLNDCETKGSFGCARRLWSGIRVEDTMTSAKQNYYYFIVDTPGAVFFELDAVPGLPSEREFDVYLRNAANSSGASLLLEKSAKGGEVLRFYGGPLSKGEYYLHVKESGTHSAAAFKLKYQFLNTDLNELNETFATATLLSLSEVKTGTMLSSQDKDYFRFYQHEPGVIEVRLDAVPDLGAGSRLYATVFSAAVAGSQVRQVSRYSGETMKFAAGPMDTGYHYLLLDGEKESPDIYHLSVVFDTSDRYELNNTFTQSKPVNLAQQIRGTIRASGDNDYFMFVAGSNLPATFTIPSVPGGISNMYVQLYSDANTGALMGYRYKDAHEPLIYVTTENLVAGKTYYVRLYGTGESEEQYVLTITQ